MRVVKVVDRTFDVAEASYMVEPSLSLCEKVFLPWASVKYQVLGQALFETQLFGFSRDDTVRIS